MSQRGGKQTSVQSVAINPRWNLQPEWSPSESEAGFDDRSSSIIGFWHRLGERLEACGSQQHQSDRSRNVHRGSLRWQSDRLDGDDASFDCFGNGLRLVAS